MEQNKTAAASNALAPFYPPQIAQDNFQRLVAPIPGATKLEAFTLAVYCAKIEGCYRSLKAYTPQIIADASIKEAVALMAAIAEQVEVLTGNKEGGNGLTVIH